MPRVPSYLFARETRIMGGTVHAGEFSVAMLPRNWQYDSSVPTVIYCGALGGGAHNLLGWFAYLELVKRGFAVACSDLSDTPSKWAGGDGPGVWGNDTSRSRGAELITWCGNVLKTDTSRIVIMGGSHGAAAACGIALDNLASTIAIALAIPAVDLEDIRANNRNGYQAGIETAYTNNATWQTARPTHNPVQIADDLAAIPVYNTYGTADTICIESTQLAFETAHGDTTMVAMAGVAHNTTSVNWPAMVDWIEALV